MTNDRRLPRTNPPQKVHREGLHHRGNEPVGAIEYRSRDGSWKILPPGSAGQVLTMQANGEPAWTTP